MQVCRVTDIGIATCGHPTVAITGSQSVKAEKSPIHRHGDTGVNAGPYVAITAAATVSNSI